MDPDGSTLIPEGRTSVVEAVSERGVEETNVSKEAAEQKIQKTTEHGKTTVTVTIDNFKGFSGFYLWLKNAFKKDTPEGFNSKRRFVSRWILWGVVFGLVRSRLLIALGCSGASIIVLKEGTIFSGKNLKWMILAQLSFATSVTAWALKRGHDSIERDAPVMKMILRSIIKFISVSWSGVLGLFLLSALLSSKRDQEALKAAALKAVEAGEKAVEVGGKAAERAAAAGEKAVEDGKKAAGKAVDDGKKAAGKAAGRAARKLDEFAKKME